MNICAQYLRVTQAFLCIKTLCVRRPSFSFSSLTLFSFLAHCISPIRILKGDILECYLVSLLLNFIYIWRHAFRRSTFNFIDIHNVCHVCTSQQLTHKPNRFRYIFVTWSKWQKANGKLFKITETSHRTLFPFRNCDIF